MLFTWKYLSRWEFKTEVYSVRLRGACMIVSRQRVSLTRHLILGKIVRPVAVHIQKNSRFVFKEFQCMASAIFYCLRGNLMWLDSDRRSWKNVARLLLIHGGRRFFLGVQKFYLEERGDTKAFVKKNNV